MIEQSNEKRELELYIHIPFCVKKCDYCDFLSFSNKSDTWEAYIKSLLQEIESCKSFGQSYEVSSIFFGGGTPSLLPEQFIVSVLNVIRNCFHVKKDVEITIECNPGTLTQEKLRTYYTNGINRLSIGLQSTDNEMLHKLGRIHTYEDFLLNYEMARKIGFRNINIDFMSSLPVQSLIAYEKSLKEIVQLEPEHISAYSLIIEPDTLFYQKYESDMLLREKGLPTKELPNDDTEYEITSKTREILNASGFLHYEISNFAKPGYECKHNIGYWNRTDYLGFGLGAASLYQNIRFSNTRDLKEYLNEYNKGSLDIKNATRNEQLNKKRDIQRLTPKQQMEEFMFLGLRQIKGISIEKFEQSFKQSLSLVYGSEINKLIQQRLLKEEKSWLIPTLMGIDLNNYVCAQFLKD